MAEIVLAPFCQTDIIQRKAKLLDASLLLLKSRDIVHNVETFCRFTGEATPELRSLCDPFPSLEVEERKYRRNKWRVYADFLFFMPKDRCTIPATCDPIHVYPTLVGIGHEHMSSRMVDEMPKQ